jgi:hypothetical protein
MTIHKEIASMSMLLIGAFIGSSISECHPVILGIAVATFRWTISILGTSG